MPGGSPLPTGLPIVRALLRGARTPTTSTFRSLLWWAIEAKAESDRAAVLALFQEPSVWSLPIVERSILERLMQRYAMAGGAGEPRDLRPPAGDGAGAARDDAADGRHARGVPRPRDHGIAAQAGRVLDRYEQGLGKSDLALGLRRGDPDASPRRSRSSPTRRPIGRPGWPTSRSWARSTNPRPSPRSPNCLPPRRRTRSSGLRSKP